VAPSDGRWSVSQPPEIVIADDVVLRRVVDDDLEPLVAAVNVSLDHLRPWMPWAQRPATSDSIGEFLREAAGAWASGREFQYAIRVASSSAIVGCCGLHARCGPGALEIGYWVHVDYLRSGIATVMAQALTSTALNMEGVERVQIRCDEANVASAAVPSKLGYRLRGTEHRAPLATTETGTRMVWETGSA
jgi:RimJ/RimL family protein N-acetyltransferase